MSDGVFDVVIVGGGLAGGLTALALHQARPNFRIAIIEAGKTFGGNHRWSWFASDLDKRGTALVEAFRKIDWGDGYDVSFPLLKRTLGTGYTSLSSADFHEGLSRLLPPEAMYLGRKATQITADAVTLDDGTNLEARLVVDARTFQPSAHLKGGWQVFMGRHIRLNHAHGVERPVIMDGDVDQVAPYGNGAAYRFVYVLPLGAHDVFIEDTYYADEGRMDRAALSGRIDQYAAARGWNDGVPVGHEAGLLPVLTGGDFNAYLDEVRTDGVVAIGARGGFTHPLTSYTIPIAVDNAIVLADEADLPPRQMAALFEARARRHWRVTAYYRLLNRFLFFAADPERRVNVLQRFYGLRQGLIERFYAGRSPLRDKVRILSGKPPVSIRRAIAAMFQSGKPLKQRGKSDINASSTTEPAA